MKGFKVEAADLQKHQHLATDLNFKCQSEQQWRTPFLQCWSGKCNVIGKIHTSNGLLWYRNHSSPSQLPSWYSCTAMAPYIQCREHHKWSIHLHWIQRWSEQPDPQMCWCLLCSRYWSDHVTWHHHETSVGHSEWPKLTQCLTQPWSGSWVVCPGLASGSDLPLKRCMPHQVANTSATAESWKYPLDTPIRMR